MYMSSMDRTSDNEVTVLSSSAENLLQQKSLKDILYQKVSGYGKAKSENSLANGQNLKIFVKKAHEKKRKNEVKNETKKEEISDSISLEALHVRRVYDQIAPHIQDLKQRTWPRVKEFLQSLTPGSLIADIGCGNGRYLHINPSIFKTGSDICLPFLQSASLRGYEVLCADNLLLPYRDSIFDAAVSIGVIHHFASQERRVQALRELARIVAPGGLMMVYVWAFEQKYRKFDSQDILVPWHKPSKSESGHRRPRLSSLPDADHLSTSSTGSSLSDEDFTSCVCCQSNRNSYSHKSNFQIEPLESCPTSYKNGDSCVQDEGTQEPLLRKKTNIPVKHRCSSQEKDWCKNSEVGKSYLEQQLAKGEALIRECQKVESYLSSLCKSPWDSVSDRSNSSNETPEKLSLSGSLDKQDPLVNSTNYGLNCPSPPQKEDEVFLTAEHSLRDLVTCKEIDPDDAAKLGSTHRTTAQLQQSVECAFDSSLANDSPQHQPQERDSDNHDFVTLPQSSAQYDASSGRSCSKEKCLQIRNSYQKGPNGTVSCGIKESKEQLQDSFLDEGHTDEIFEDDFCVVDLKKEEPLTEMLPSSDCSPAGNSPKSMFDTFKMRFKNLFSRTKPENGRHAVPCFVPCLTVPRIPMPQECFQIREFPQSSLPSGSAQHDPQPNEDSASIHSCESAGVVSAGFKSSLPQNENEFTNVFQCQKLPTDHVTYQKDWPKRHAATAAAYCSRNCDIANNITNQEMNVHTQPVLKKTENALSGSKPLQDGAESEMLPSTTPEKGDAINTDLCRFYHVFREGELVDLVTCHIPEVKLVDSFYDHANWCLILEKV